MFILGTAQEMFDQPLDYETFGGFLQEGMSTQCYFLRSLVVIKGEERLLHKLMGVKVFPLKKCHSSYRNMTNSDFTYCLQNILAYLQAR